MPGMDGTGPLGMGPRTGLGRGVCRSTPARFNGYGYGYGLGYGRAVGYGRGCGLGPGYGRAMGYCRFAGASEREVLTNIKASLQDQLASIEKRLEKL